MTNSANQTAQEAARQLAQDWHTIWQTEFAGLAHDREAAEVLAVQAHLWQAFGKMMNEAAHVGRPTPAPVAPQRAAPADAASGAEPDEAERLRLRVAELERRLAELDRPAPAKRNGRKPAGRKAAPAA